MIQKLVIFCAAIGLSFAVIAEPTTTTADSANTGPVITATTSAIDKTDVKTKKHHKSAKTELNLNSAVVADLEKAGLTKEQAEKIIAARPADGFKHVKEACKALDKDGKKAVKALKKRYKLVTQAVTK